MKTIIDHKEKARLYTTLSMEKKLIIEKAARIGGYCIFRFKLTPHSGETDPLFRTIDPPLVQSFA